MEMEAKKDMDSVPWGCCNAILPATNLSLESDH